MPPLKPPPSLHSSALRVPAIALKAHVMGSLCMSGPRPQLYRCWAPPPPLRTAVLDTSPPQPLIETINEQVLGIPSTTSSGMYVG